MRGRSSSRREKVTQTSMLDMAASVARVKMILGVLKGPPILIKGSEGDTKILSEGFANSLCAFSARGGHLAVLKWARAHGYPWNEETCALAAMNGHLEVLQWARDHGCPWSESTCEKAAKNGHLEVLQWARAHGCPWDERTCEKAAENGHLEVLQWAQEQGCPEWD